jgi:hypothetical protein
MEIKRQPFQQLFPKNIHQKAVAEIFEVKSEKQSLLRYRQAKSAQAKNQIMAVGATYLLWNSRNPYICAGPTAGCQGASRTRLYDAVDGQPLYAWAGIRSAGLRAAFGSLWAPAGFDLRTVTLHTVRPRRRVRYESRRSYHSASNSGLRGGARASS